ncbi:MAG: hypothetical protein ACRCXT_18140 [Paraclostridium sp.]
MEYNFLDTENATIHFEYGDGCKFSQIEKNILVNMNELNIKLAYTNYFFTNSVDLDKTIDKVKEYSNLFLCINDFPIEQFDEFENTKIKEYKENIIFICPENYSIPIDILEKGYLVRVIVGIDTAIDILNNYSKYLSQIIIKFKKDITDLSKFINSIKEESDIYLWDHVVSSDIVFNHPCNIYLCKNSTCHGKKGDFPRNLYINNNGDIYPYDDIFTDLCIGNIYKENIQNIITKYSSSNVKNDFNNLNQSSYLSYFVQGSMQYAIWKNCLYTCMLKGGLNYGI